MTRTSISVTILASALVVFAARRARIHNGLAARDIRQFPWVVFLSERQFILCTASLIGRTKILTAAHCVCDKRVEDLVVVTRYLGQDGKYAKSYTVRAKHTHPKFLTFRACNIYGQYDLSILETHENIELNFQTQVINVDFNPLKNNSDVIIQGYGENESGRAGILRYAFTKAYNCKSGKERFVCASTIGNRISYGDSGGPLVACETFNTCRQVGVNSFFDDAKFAGFASTHVEADFIRNHM